MFAKLDSVIGKLLEMADSKDLFVAVVSDHGMGPRKVDVKPNWLLHKWGYLKFRNPLQRSIRRSRRNLQSLFQHKKTRVSVEHKMPINWPRSKAVMLYTEINGFVFLNVKGRQPGGCVEPGKEYEDIITDLCKRFSEASSPLNGMPLFAHVARPAELYGVDQIDNERFGDLILVPQPYHFLKSKASKKGVCAKLLQTDFLKGTHMPGGMYILSGPNTKTAVKKQTQIVNIAPTIYAVLGAKLPTYMDGKVLTDAFLQEISIKYQNGNSQCAEGISEKQQFSDDEEALIAKHLADLGYLD